MDYDQIEDFLNEIIETEENRVIISEIRKHLAKKDLIRALNGLKKLKQQGFEYKQQDIDKDYEEEENKQMQEENELGYPPNLANDEPEERYIGVLLNEPKSISVYYFIYDDSFFVNDELLNIYKTLIFTDVEKYAPEIAKNKFRFPERTLENDMLKKQLKTKYRKYKKTLEEVYIDLKKIFTLRKSFLKNPVKSIQKKIAEILDYELYDQMSVEEVESAIEQVTATEKFKRAILNEDITNFLVKGDNTLTNGLNLPFKILTDVFKGIRKGETMAFAMPSNAGKSRFTMNLASYIALLHKKKVLVISNEMSEEKMKLCLITTIINNPDIQKLHKQKIRKTEGELLEFKYRPDEIFKTKVEVDEDGFIKKEKEETHEHFISRLEKYSSEFKMTIAVTDWFNKQTQNYMYFINITDHTNDELKKVIMNYYYKEKVEYIFYDTLKTDIDNIGVSYEIKKTATILSNLAQNFQMFIASTLQLAETDTDPINLSINDLAVSGTVKEVLDTLSLFKQIHKEDLKKYEYSLNEVDDKFYDLEEFKNPDIRYYTCVVDKNRAGSKPKLVFRLNLAYNEWNELGYIRIK